MLQIKVLTPWLSKIEKKYELNLKIKLKRFQLTTDEANYYREHLMLYLPWQKESDFIDYKNWISIRRKWREQPTWSRRNNSWRRRSNNWTNGYSKTQEMFYSIDTFASTVEWITNEDCFKMIDNLNIRQRIMN